MAASGRPGASRVPATSTVPPSKRSIPKTARATSLRPAPTRPASATISPARISNEHVGEDALAGEPLHLEHALPDLGVALREQRADLAADHPPDEVVRGHVRRGGVVDDLAVAHHRDRRADREDLLEAVGDEEHRGAAVAQRAHDAEQPLDLGPGERRGRLVHDQHPRVERQRLGDLDDLLVGDREAADGARGVEPDAEAVELLLHLAVHQPAVDPARALERVPAHDDVLRHREVGEERRLLIDDGDAGRAGVGRGAEVHDLAVDEHLAAVEPDHAGEQLDERRLARAVLPHQRADLAGPQGDRAVAQRLDGAVGLHRVAQLEDRGRVAHRTSSDQDPAAAQGGQVALGRVGGEDTGDGVDARDRAQPARANFDPSTSRIASPEHSTIERLTCASSASASVRTPPSEMPLTLNRALSAQWRPIASTVCGPTNERVTARSDPERPMSAVRGASDCATRSIAGIEFVSTVI
jgi:hypothetical protein